MRTYRGRSPEEQKQFNAERKRKVEEAKAKKKQGLDIYDNEYDDINLHLEAENVTIPKVSWQDQILSRFKSVEDDDDRTSTTKKEKDHIDRSSSLLSSVLPMTISGIVALYAQKIFSDDFKACAPTKQEVSTILLPLFSIIHRHSKIDGKLSQDAIDVSASLFAVITVSTRMLLVAEEIKNAKQVSSNHSEKRASSSPVDIRGGTGQNNSFSPDTAFWSNTGTDGTNGNPTRAGNGSANGNGVSVSNAAIDQPNGAAIVANLLRRDTEGRRQMGLIPRTMADGN